MRTHYDLMNVSEGALDEVIRAAYRVLARRYHPDRNGNSSSSVERMQALNEAYDVLTDPVRRRQYDEMLRGERLRQSRMQAAFQAQATYQTPAGRSQPHFVRRSTRRGRHPVGETAGQKLVSLLMWDVRLTAVVVFLLVVVGRELLSKPERSYPSLPPPAYSHPGFPGPR